MTASTFFQRLTCLLMSFISVPAWTQEAAVLEKNQTTSFARVEAAQVAYGETKEALSSESAMVDVPEPASSNAGSDQLSSQTMKPERAQSGRMSGSFRLKAEKSEWATLLREHIPEFVSNPEAQNITPSLLRRMRQDIGDILATEGYFSPQIQFENLDEVALRDARSSAEKVISVHVDPGQRTKITSVNIQFSGALNDAIEARDQTAINRRNEALKVWKLTEGTPFSEDAWSQSKNQLTENLRTNVYASAKLSNSEANVDADASTADLALTVDSGPVFTFGALQVTGLKRYQRWILDRYQPPREGELYSRARLLEFQRALQNSPYFSSVAVAIEADPDLAKNVPIEVSLVERKPRDLSFGLGYSTNTGFRSEIAYRDRDILSRAWDLRSAIRIEQKRQVGYADIYLPPNDNKLDSFGVISDHENVSGVLTVKNAVGIKRTSTNGHVEQRLGLNLVREKITIEDEPTQINRALVASVGWTWRDVDDTFAPRKGEIYQLDLAASEKALLSDQRFFRIYGKYQRWIPVGTSDSIILRAEAGQVFSDGIEGIPEDYLFRTGGSSTVRGYSYQSLGIHQGNAVTGGRVMSVVSAEYVHWLDRTWGIATFIDAGDASDNWRDLSMSQAFGVGGRYRTPAGPIALDLAYGKQAKKLRLDFSIAIAF
ncbi:autotransporter assembly complex protein TamA [Undibacterium sp. Ji67W]|uniref:autotransporter assembly complex protein TamA n=1 Tax=Undibacterium sp. Ji67W TaxID=3413042 RepID=UPI003BF35898